MFRLCLDYSVSELSDYYLRNVSPSSGVRGSGLMVENRTRLWSGNLNMSHCQTLIRIDSACVALLLNDDS